jgi:hypothetical protein
MRELGVRSTVLITCFLSAGIIDGAERTGPDWAEVTTSAQWKARDSQGEIVFNNRLWILGGWFNSYGHRRVMSGAPPTETVRTEDTR